MIGYASVEFVFHNVSNAAAVESRPRDCDVELTEIVE